MLKLIPATAAVLLAAAVHAGPAAPAREEMLAGAEEALRRGEVERAGELFTQAGFIKHAADAEIGLVRTYMQAGEYRRALAFAAHTAGAHPDPAGKAMYAQLLDAGGQGAVAARIVRVPPGRLAPYSPESAALPKEVRLVSSGMLLADRRMALSRATSPGERLWVRNALGAVVAARVLRRIDELDLALLELERPFDGAALAPAPRDAFPGSPAFAIEYPASEDAAPAWPLLRVGFVGQKDLGIALPPGPRGGPVLDRNGRLVGLAVTDAAGRDQLVPVSVLKARLGAALAETESHPITVEEIYERALAATLQVIAAPR